ncbi:MAG: 5-formyltetrahydrofolate cyclo-ligase [Bdellovibrionales bacterium]|nr:5-formyltetrahydrofolate cyclo-ligase [Bdellovibrionales bacterium]
MTALKKKSLLRKEFLERRNSHYESERVCSGQSTQQIGESLSLILSQLNVENKICASYRAFGSEADPSLVERLLPDWQWAFPRINDDHLEFYLMPSTQQWEVNGWGIQEPLVGNPHKIELNDCGAVLVPGRAFDRNGHRLGGGKGYYDRALANYVGLKVGVGFAVQVSNDPLPVEGFDIDMDYLVTEDFVIDFGVSATR